MHFYHIVVQLAVLLEEFRIPYLQLSHLHLKISLCLSQFLVGNGQFVDLLLVALESFLKHFHLLLIHG